MHCCVCVGGGGGWERVFALSRELWGHLEFWLRLTPVSSCVSCVGLLVQDLTDTILSSYAYKSHYLLTESNRAELKLPMIPSPSSATKKNVGKGNWTAFLFLLVSHWSVSVSCLLPLPRPHTLVFLVGIFHFKALRCKVNSLVKRRRENAVNFNAEWCKVTSAKYP